MSCAYVLLSGGIDSTTCLYSAVSNTGHIVHGLSIFYGQRHKKEIEYAKKSCEALSVSHTVLDISAVMPTSPLTDPLAHIPDKTYDELHGVSPTYVPFRNGLLLSCAASYIQGKRQSQPVDDKEEWLLYFGAHAEDAKNWAYPDCTPEFTGAMANAILVGTYNQLRLVTPLQWMNKAEIIKYGESLEVNWLNTWSCYRGVDIHCGKCPTCYARKSGFTKAGIDDPTTYSC